MMVLRLTPKQLAAIAQIGQQAYPEEGCGILLGESCSKRVRQLTEVRRVPNVWSAEADIAGLMPKTTAERTKTSRYTVDPKDLLQAQRDARNRGLDIIGIVHSHPDHPALPSECDRAVAWPGYSYLIVSVDQGNPKDILSWRLDNNRQFQPEALLITA